MSGYWKCKIISFFYFSFAFYLYKVTWCKLSTQVPKQNSVATFSVMAASKQILKPGSANNCYSWIRIYTNIWSPCISFPQYQLLNLVFVNKKKFSSCAHFISSAIKLSSPINLFIIIICTDPTCKRHHLVRQAEMIAEMFRESVSGQFNNAFYAQIMSCLKFWIWK